MGIYIYVFTGMYICLHTIVESDTPHKLIYYYNERVVLKARKIACHLEGSRASSLATPALTVTPLEPRWGKSVCSLISKEAGPRHV